MTESAPAQPAPPHSRLRRLLWPDWEQRKKMLRVEAWALVFASYALLAFAWLWPQDYRNDSTGYLVASWAAILVRTMQFHLGLLLLVVALAAAFGRGRRLFLATVPLLLFTLVPALWQYLPKDAPAASGPALRVMSVNLLMVNREHDAIINEIRSADPDVLLFQEYTYAWDEALLKALGEQYPHRSTIPETEDDSFGIGVYSRLPFAEGVNDRLMLGRHGTPQMRSVVRFGGRDVAVYNIHLLPPRRLDYTAEHRRQVADLLDELAGEPLPYVLVGDFNFPETAPQHADLLRVGAREAHAMAGKGRGATWPVRPAVFRYLPGLRFDHVYLGPGLVATKCEAGRGTGSDHRPVVADVYFEVEAEGPPDR